MDNFITQHELWEDDYYGAPTQLWNGLGYFFEGVSQKTFTLSAPASVAGTLEFTLQDSKANTHIRLYDRPGYPNELLFEADIKDDALHNYLFEVPEGGQPQFYIQTLDPCLNGIELLLGAPVEPEPPVTVAARLIKLAKSVFVPGRPQANYRPPSKDCPPPLPIPAPKRWIKKTVCGTRTVTLSFTPPTKQGGTDGKAFIYTHYLVDGFIDQTTVVPFSGSGAALGTFPYCTTVTVYE